MSDAVRMIDLGVLSRGLEAFRRLDPGERALAEQLAGRAAIQRVEEAHEDVTEAEQASETGFREHEEERRGRSDDPAGQEDSVECELEPPPEVDEGHLLNIKV